MPEGNPVEPSPLPARRIRAELRTQECYCTGQGALEQQLAATRLLDPPTLRITKQAQQRHGVMPVEFVDEHQDRMKRLAQPARGQL